MLKKDSSCKNLRRYFKEYCNNTSIHGFKYFGERRGYLERSWWLLVFCLCLSCCAYFITMVYKKWASSPIIVSLETRETQIYDIPFPAVTICPQTKAKTNLYSHTAMVQKLARKEALTDEEYRRTSYMNLLCDLNMTSSLRSHYKNDTFDNYFYSDGEFFDFMFKVAPTVFGIVDCKWMSDPYKCADIFETVVTDEGVCFTFNMLDNAEIYQDSVVKTTRPHSSTRTPKATTSSWNLDTGYQSKKKMDTYPRRALFSGAQNGLSLKIWEDNSNIDKTCKLSLQGFKVMLHSPGRVPRLAQQYFILPLNQTMLAAVQPTMIRTSETVKVFRPEYRDCFFQNEKKLEFFKVYTQRNCQLECLAIFTDYWCDCVGFFMPRNNATKICGALSEPCMQEAERILQAGHLREDLVLKEGKKSTNDTEDEIPECHCLPLCTDIQYDMEVTSTVWNWDQFMNAMFPNDSLVMRMYKPMSMSTLVVYFKNSRFATSKRQELYGPTDFLANFGGLLGLFTGFSIISFVEIIYFLTVRIICNVKRYGNWSGDQK